MSEAAAADAATVRTRENLLVRAEGLTDTIRERSDATEEDRRLAPETMQAMRESGIQRILQPARHGGAEAHFSGMADIVETDLHRLQRRRLVLDPVLLPQLPAGLLAGRGTGRDLGRDAGRHGGGRPDPELRPGRAR